MSSAQRAIPAASADSTVTARFSTRSAATSSTVAGAEVSTTRANGREKSVASSGSTVTAVGVIGGWVDEQPLAVGRHQQQATFDGAEHPGHRARRP